jgi:hypothetical protein
MREMTRVNEHGNRPAGTPDAPAEQQPVAPELPQPIELPKPSVEHAWQERGLGGGTAIRG